MTGLNIPKTKQYRHSIALTTRQSKKLQDDFGKLEFLSEASEPRKSKAKPQINIENVCEDNSCDQSDSFSSHSSFKTDSSIEEPNFSVKQDKTVYKKKSAFNLLDHSQFPRGLMFNEKDKPIAKQKTVAFAEDDDLTES